MRIQFERTRGKVQLSPVKANWPRVKRLRNQCTSNVVPRPPVLWTLSNS